jgi:LuxR family maltose regulon positive regulatory protein
LLTAVHCSLITGAGDDAAYWIGLASDLPRSDGCSEVSELDMLMLRTTYPMEGTASMGADAGRALELTAPGDVWHGAAALYRGVSMHLLGDAESAVPMLRDAARSTAVTSPVIQALALSQLALIACDGGQRSSAVRLISEARGQVDRCGLSEYLAMVLVGAVETMILALEGRTGRAHDSLANGLRLLGLLTSFPAWYEAEARLAFTAACLRLYELGSAHKLISEAREHLKQTPDAVVLVEWLNTLQVELDSRTGEISANSSKLTRAELRTLQHLPTHLSFRQIGEVDHVSTNTVKTQARSIYRKLGVGSRAEAVEAARKAGLLLEQS